MTVTIYIIGIIITYVMGLVIFPFIYNRKKGGSEEAQRNSYGTTLLLASLTWVLSIPILFIVVFLLLIMFIITTLGEWVIQHIKVS